MQLRTDLALEAAEQAPEIFQLTAQDVEKKHSIEGDAAITRIHIHSRRGGEALRREPGRYITVEVPPLSDNEDKLVEYARLIGRELAALLPETGAVLITGLGNEAITPDALGPKAARMILATRHIQGEFARSSGLDDLRPTAVLAPGVLGQTGVESGEIVGGLCGVVRPCAVIAIDALASRSVARLGCTV